MTPGAVVGALADRVRAAAPLLGPVRLVCVDGPAGSGKTTLADALAVELGPGAAVVHLDDLYEGWGGLEGVAERVETGLLVPLAQGRDGSYRRYDWVAGRLDGTVAVPVPDVLVVEGCGSAPRSVDGRAVLRVWVEAPADERLARGLARDGEHLRPEWLAWTAAETAHFAREDTRRRADVVVDTGTS